MRPLPRLATSRLAGVGAETGRAQGQAQAAPISWAKPRTPVFSGPHAARTTSGPRISPSTPTSDGRGLKWLSLIDEYTRECLALEARRGMTAEKIQVILAEAAGGRAGEPLAERLRGIGSRQVARRFLGAWRVRERSPSQGLGRALEGGAQYRTSAQFTGLQDTGRRCGGMREVRCLSERPRPSHHPMNNRARDSQDPWTRKWRAGQKDCNHPYCLAAPALITMERFGPFQRTLS